ncbi:hypothetical protein K2P97_05520 [bacterium]|nr:hypothetical protein [bacterium]
MNFKLNYLAPLVIGCVLAGCQAGTAGSEEATSEDLDGIAQNLSRTVSLAVISISNCQFNGVTIENGNAITAYLNSSEAAGGTCVSEQRICTDGILSGEYQYSSCAVNQPASCLFNGQTVANGETVLAYNTTNIEIGEECTSENRTCNNGILSGSFQYASCNINLPASCLFNGETIAHGASVAAYTNSTAPFGSSCSQEFRTCDNGNLSGSNQYATCAVEQPASCLFNGLTVAHGQLVPAFLNSTESYGSTCTSENRICTNGVLSGSYQYGSCVVNQAASCLFNGQTITSGDSVSAFQSSTVEYGQMCIAETRICDDGRLSGTYNYASCDAGQPASCLFNGQTITHGQSVTAFVKSTVSFGSTCSSQIRTCDNGTLSGSNIYASCVVDSPKACLFNNQTINDGQSVVAYKATSAKSPALCESETRICSNGVLSGSYTKATCVTENCNPKDKKTKKDKCDYEDSFKDDDRTIKLCKKVVEIKKSENACGLHNQQFLSSWYHHKERWDCGLHLGWYKHKRHENNCHKRKGWSKHKKTNDSGHSNH